jgi:acid phosphatase type 7
MICKSSFAKLPGSVQRRSTVIFLFLAVVAVASAEDGPRAFLKVPYLQAPGTDTMTIMWESATNKPGTVHYGLKGQLDQELRLDAPRELLAVTPSAGGSGTEGYLTNTVFLYEMTLTNLEANAVYAYSAETDGVRTPAKRFKTFGAHPDKVTFIAYGDTRSNPKLHAAIAANFKQYSPDFILHTGDLVGAGKRYDLWGKEFFEPLAAVIDEVPILPAIGNHEQDGINYLHYLHLPGKETAWYSCDVGPVHVLSLDYRYEKETDDQFAFARRDLLATKSPWKIVMLHFPVFNIGGHGTRWGHAAYLPLFHQAKVDLVIAGHSHIYERFQPVAPKTGADTWPITHITTGGGGAPLYTTLPHPALAAQVATNHFLVIEATPTSLTGRAIAANNTVIDKFELKKSGGRLSADYLAKVYSEELLDLAFDAAPSLTAELASAPGTDSPAQVMFTLRPLVKIQQPVELEIGLTPDSAANYEIKGGPLHVTIPSPTESSKPVWASVRATGQRNAEARGTRRELTPALVFQARVKAGTDETLAYGQKSRVSEAAAEAAKK